MAEDSELPGAYTFDICMIIASQVSIGLSSKTARERPALPGKSVVGLSLGNSGHCRAVLSSRAKRLHDARKISRQAGVSISKHDAEE
jgi:hypothetical protein